MKKSKCSFFSKEIQYLGHILSATSIQPLPSKTYAIQNMNLLTTPEQVRAFLGLVGYYRKFIRGFTKIAKPLTLLTRQQVKFDWTPEHHEAFLHLKEAIVQAPILHYPNPNKSYIVYTDASDDACRAQLSQEHNGTEFPVAFLSHTFTETQHKWSTTEQEAFGVYYTITKWNYYLQGADIIVQNDHKPLAQSLNGKNTNNKVNRWIWNSPHKISHLNGSLEPRIRLQIASPGYSHIQPHTSTCSQPPSMMDQPSIPEVIPRVPQIPHQPFPQMLYPTSPRMPSLPQNH